MVRGPDGFKKRFGFFKGSRTLSMKNLIAKMSPMIALIDLHQLCRIERSSDGVRVCFPKLKFKGKGHETADMRRLMNKYAEWAHILVPEMNFDDFVEKLEK